MIALGCTQGTEVAFGLEREDSTTQTPLASLPSSRVPVGACPLMTFAVRSFILLFAAASTVAITYTIHCHKSPHPLFTRALSPSLLL